METKDLLKKAILGVIEQGEPSVEKGFCLYRKNRQKGCKIRCAVGHLISDNTYTKRLEDETVQSRLIKDAIYKSIGRRLTEEEVIFLAVLQDGHDEASFDPVQDFLSSFKNEITRSVKVNDLPEYCLEFIK